MAGVPGSGGPVPKRVNQRHGHRSAAENAADAPTRAPGAETVEVPPADESWHPIARSWYEALGRSGQSAFYEDSDWWTAFAVAESMSREFSPQPLVVGSGRSAEVQMVALPPKAASLAAWLKASSELLATEGSRRRLRLELERPKPDEGEGGDVSWIDDARRRLTS